MQVDLSGWSRCRRQLLCALALATGAFGASPLPSRAQEVGRLNRVIEQAERGELIFTHEDWIFLPDQEHDLFGLLKLQAAMAALRPEGSRHPTLTPIARIGMEANHQEKHIVKQYLDAGLMGLILPQTETAEEVLQFVKSMRYPPQQGGRFFGGFPVGQRGWSPGSAARYWGVDLATYARKADLWPLNPEGELLAIMLLETEKGVQNIEQILEVPGLGVVLMGLGDLSMNMGVGTPAAAMEDPRVTAAVAKFAEACRDHHAKGGKVICGRFQMPEGVPAAIAQGFTMFVSDRPAGLRDPVRRD